MKKKKAKKTKKIKKLHEKKKVQKKPQTTIKVKRRKKKKKVNTILVYDLMDFIKHVNKVQLDKENTFLYVPFEEIEVYKNIIKDLNLEYYLEFVENIEDKKAYKIIIMFNEKRQSNIPEHVEHEDDSDEFADEFFGEGKFFGIDK